MRESNASALTQRKALLGPPLTEQVNVMSLPLLAMIKSGLRMTLFLGETVEVEKTRHLWCVVSPPIIHKT